MAAAEPGGASAPARFRETARAKVNLDLRVLGRRDDGYHELESLVAFAAAGDALTLEPGPDFALVVEGPEASILAASGGEGDGNLIAKAWRALAERRPGLRPGRVRLVKTLPVASGVGGGSADAAAALRLFARANSLRPDDAVLFDAAAACGADVPVCLAQRSRIMRGVGERLGPPLALPEVPALLVNPRVATPTPAVFAALGLSRGERRDPAGAAASGRLEREGAPRDAAALAALLGETSNDLTAPALSVAPAIGDALAALDAAPGRLIARMSGSGATCFALFADPSQVAEAARRIAKAHPDWWIRETTLGGEPAPA